MATNSIPIRPWSRLASLRSSPAPDSLPKPESAELSVKTTNTSSHEKQESATKSIPKTPDFHIPMQSQKLKLSTSVSTKGKGSDGHGIRVTTISGENQGACLQISTPHKKPIRKLRALYANSNVQCVNNSIVLNTRLTHHDPGMHLIIPKQPFGEGFHLKERGEVQRN